MGETRPLVAICPVSIEEATDAVELGCAARRKVIYSPAFEPLLVAGTSGAVVIPHDYPSDTRLS